jgi:tetratricopeptide (TPR) repeat protein
MARVNRIPAPLLGICLLGLFIGLTILGAMALITRYSDTASFGPAPGPGEDRFYRDLRAFDLSLGRADSKDLHALLDRLEKNALGVESRLSVLKRRRNLARRDAAFRDSYRTALNRALGEFPFSEALAALAAEALILENPGSPENTGEKIKGYASLISDNRLMPLAFGLYALSGAMKDPEETSAIPRRESLFSSVDPLLLGEEKNTLRVNFAILRLLDGDIPGAAALVALLLQEDPSPESRRFGAEFLYDYGDPLEAARLFSSLTGERALSRQADALLLAGHIPRNIWLALSSPEPSGAQERSGDIRARALYNLALNAGSREEKQAFLERLIAAPEETELKTFGIIEYTRLFDVPRAISILEGTDTKNIGPLDLELLRRRRERWTLDRTAAETWLLLNRHPEDERLYRWGAYFFDRQKQYGETALLLQTAGYNHIHGSWMTLHESLRLLREGQVEEGENLLKSIPMDRWQVPANLARIEEARRSPSRALEYYEIAASLVRIPVEAAKIQLRIARCLRALGREGEIRRVLQYAQDLDPENINVRLELHRLDAQGIY